MCVDPITVKPIHVDGGHEPSFLNSSLNGDDELLAIDDNGSNLDDYDCIVKTDYQYESNSWPGEDEEFENMI